LVVSDKILAAGLLLTMGMAGCGGAASNAEGSATQQTNVTTVCKVTLASDSVYVAGASCPATGSSNLGIMAASPTIISVIAPASAVLVDYSNINQICDPLSAPPVAGAALSIYLCKM
jgi:hypothetical protein